MDSESEFRIEISETRRSVTKFSDLGLGMRRSERLSRAKLALQQAYEPGVLAAWVWQGGPDKDTQGPRM